MDIETKKRLEELLRNTGDMALKRRARKIIEEIDPRRKDKILEVGCGDGYYLHLISNLGVKNLKLTGIDIDKEALKSATRNLKGQKIILMKADLMKKLPFRNTSFDKVIMSEVTEHLPNDVKGLQEVNRVLKRGGSLVITVPNHNYPFLWDPVNWTSEHFFNTHIKNGFWAGLWNQHLRLYKLGEIKKTITDAGFKVKEATSLTWWCLPFNHYLINLTALAIHSGKLNPAIKSAVNKYETKVKRPMFLNLAFFVASAIDKLNDFLPIKNSGVGVFVKAQKQ